MLSGRQQQAAGGDDMTDGDSPTEDSPAPQSQRPSSQPAASKRPPGASPLAALPSPPSQAPPANPFAVKSGGDKRPRGLAESLGSLVGSPSPKRCVQTHHKDQQAGRHVRPDFKHHLTMAPCVLCCVLAGRC